MNITQINSPSPAQGFDLLAELRALLARAEAAAKGIHHPMGVAVATELLPEEEPVAPKTATKETRKWMLGKLAVYGESDLVKYALTRNILLPIEKLTDWPLHKVPTSKEAMAALVRDIEKWRDEIPMTFPPAAPAPIAATPEPEPAQAKPAATPGGLVASGKLVDASRKDGETRGKKWVKYSVKVDNEWYSTFSKTLFDEASALDQQQVEVTYEYVGDFKTLKTITGTGELVP